MNCYGWPYSHFKPWFLVKGGLCQTGASYMDPLKTFRPDEVKQLKFEWQTTSANAVPIISFSYFIEIVQQTAKIYRKPQFFHVAEEWKRIWINL